MVVEPMAVEHTVAALTAQEVRMEEPMALVVALIVVMPESVQVVQSAPLVVLDVEAEEAEEGVCRTLAMGREPTFRKPHISMWDAEVTST